MSRHGNLVVINLIVGPTSFSSLNLFSPSLPLFSESLFFFTGVLFVQRSRLIEEREGKYRISLIIELSPLEFFSKAVQDGFGR